MTSFDHPLDVDLEVLAATEPCPEYAWRVERKGGTHGATVESLAQLPPSALEALLDYELGPPDCDDVCRTCNGSGLVPSKLWRPWKPTTCPTCGGEGYVDPVSYPTDYGTGIEYDATPCPVCSDGEETGSGLVVPQVGDVINWTVEEENISSAEPDWIPVSHTTPHDAETRSRTVARSTVHQTAPIVGPGVRERWPRPCHFVRHNNDDLSRWDLGDDQLWSATNATALLDGPWAELWVPGNWALELTTEVLDD